MLRSGSHLTKGDGQVNPRMLFGEIEKLKH